MKVEGSLDGIYIFFEFEGALAAGGFENWAESGYVFLSSIFRNFGFLF